MRIFLPFILLVSLAVQAQYIIVESEVSKAPIEGVAIIDSVNNVVEHTNRRGRVLIEQYQNSESISVHKEGFVTINTSYQELVKQEFKITLKKSIFNLDEMIVSASKWQQLNAEVPNRVLTISKEEAQLQNPQTTADLLNTNGEVFIQKSQLGGGSPMIRGFAANRILITVDGVRMNNAIFRSGNLQNVIAIDANSLARAEVLFGPGSLIYGSDAIGGVMGFYTIEPQISKQKKINSKGNALLRYSTANQERTAHVDFNVFGSQFSSLTSITYSDFDDLTMGRHGPDEYLRNSFVQRIGNEDIIRLNRVNRKQVPTAYSQLNALQKFKYKPNDHWTWNYDIHYSLTSDVPRYDRLIETRNGEPRSAEWEYGPQTWLMNHLSVENNRENGVFNKFRFNLAHQFFEESRIDRRFGSDNRRTRAENVNAFSLNLDFVKNINEKQSLFYGVEAIFNNVSSEAESENILTNETESVATRYPDGSNWNSYAAYASYEYKPNKKWNIQTGIRYNYVSSHSDFSQEFFNFPFTEANIETGAFNGNLGAVYKPHYKTELRAIFSTGFRAPNIDDIGKIFDSEPGNVVVPNDDLVYEYAYNGEVGWAQIIGKRFRFDFTGYYTHLTDALVRRNSTLNGQDSIIYDGELSAVTSIQNAAKAYVYGVQIGMEAHFNRNWQLRSSFNYQKGKEELDNGSAAPLRHVSPLFGNVRLLYETKKFNASLYMNYNGEIGFDDLAPSERNKPHIYAIDENGNPFSPSWHTLNFKSSYRLSDLVTLDFGWENFTNQRYRTYSSGIVAPGSNLIFAVRAQF